MPAPETRPEARPGIVVLGAPRSGTTLLRRLLDAHPSIACPGETHLLRSCARFLERERGAEGLEIGVLSGLAFAGFPEDEVLARLRRFAFGFHEEHARRQGKTRWAEKSAFDAFHLEAIERLCGDEVTYVLLLRHGLDVVLSLRDFTEKTQGYLHELHDYVRRHPRPLVAFAHAWNDVTRQLLAFAGRHPSNAVVVRYEELVESPEDTLRRVLEFLGEPFDAELLERGFRPAENPGFGDWKTYATRKVEAGSVGRHQELPPKLRAELAEIVNPTLEAAGYPRIEVDAAEDEDEETARRRYELGLLIQSMKAGGRKG
jgi:hypothetical protein